MKIIKRIVLNNHQDFHLSKMIPTNKVPCDMIQCLLGYTKNLNCANLHVKSRKE